jgi:gluconolactonase
VELHDVEVLAEGLGFPEGPVALGDGSVVLVEINTGRLSKVGSDGEVTVLADAGGGPNGAAIGPDGAVYVCNNGGFSRETRITPCVQRVDPTTGEVSVLYAECGGKPLVGPNDIVFDERGNFWFTDFGGGVIYYASPDGRSINVAVERLRGPNGIGLSPAGDVLYWAQTYTRQLHRRRLSAPGEIVEAPPYEVMSVMRHLVPDPWTLVTGLPGAQELDSLAVEEGGAVCIGTLIDSGVTVVDPRDGSHELYTLPATLAESAVTNICFGGPDLRTAYITCSVTGRLVSCRWPRPGLKLAYQEVPA